MYEQGHCSLSLLFCERKSKVNVVFVECQEALGMEAGVISDRQITASSQRNSRHAPVQGRLNFKATEGKAGAWCAGSNDTKQWLQVDLLSKHIVTRVATQGRNGEYRQWVTKYKLQYSNDGINFQFYREKGETTDKVRYTQPE